MTTKKSKTPARVGMLAGLTVLLVSSFCLADFATLDRQSNQSQATLGLGFNIPDEGDSGDFAMHVELYGQFYYKWVGAYIDLPMNFLILENYDDEFGLGNMELGLYHVLDLGDMFSIVGRFGVGIPTSKKDLGDFIANVTGGYGRLTDLVVQSVPEATSIRPSVSAVVDTGLIFARVDVGLDVVFPDEGDNEMFLRLNAGVGVHAGPVDFTVESVNLGHLDDDDNPGTTDASEQWLHTMGFQISYPTEYVQPYFAYVLPLDDDVRGEMHLFSLGLTGRF